MTGQVNHIPQNSTGRRSFGPPGLASQMTGQNVPDVSTKQGVLIYASILAQFILTSTHEVYKLREEGPFLEDVLKLLFDATVIEYFAPDTPDCAHFENRIMLLKDVGKTFKQSFTSFVLCTDQNKALRILTDTIYFVYVLWVGADKCSVKQREKLKDIQHDTPEHIRDGAGIVGDVVGIMDDLAEKQTRRLLIEIDSSAPISSPSLTSSSSESLDSSQITVSDFPYTGASSSPKLSYVGDASLQHPCVNNASPPVQPCAHTNQYLTLPPVQQPLQRRSSNTSLCSSVGSSSVGSNESMDMPQAQIPLSMNCAYAPMYQSPGFIGTTNNMAFLPQLPLDSTMLPMAPFPANPPMVAMMPPIDPPMVAMMPPIVPPGTMIVDAYGQGFWHCQAGTNIPVYTPYNWIQC